LWHLEESDETHCVLIRVMRNSSGQGYYHLVESYRDASKVRWRTLLSVGGVGDGKLEELAAAIAKHTNRRRVIVRVAEDERRTTTCRPRITHDSATVERPSLLGSGFVHRRRGARLPEVDRTVERERRRHTISVEIAVAFG
jgi:hypothetical protein